MFCKSVRLYIQIITLHKSAIVKQVICIDHHDDQSSLHRIWPTTSLYMMLFLYLSLSYSIQDKTKHSVVVNDVEQNRNFI